MIDDRFLGVPFKSIPDRYFHYGFEQQDRYPGLVLASLNTVPLNVGHEWILASNECGGFSCNSCEAAILSLLIRPEALSILENIANEKFSPEPLDYFNIKNEPMTNTVIEGYRDYLRQVGLTCNDDNLNLLTQALYPVDATRANLQLLSDGKVDLEQFTGNGDLVIYIVGINCD
ncbi:hypothetical protein [Serratia sp. 14-2641]|uniref:hypothetical protein n=1 Tax=Serratia sp. 14-2641 TaxID=1841657 RepID=UPI00080FF06B|nr:hypothetical protein [Serratia sp. 14-2641]OCJ37342.1 hypothetical protein A6U95_24845 [Serratia sp. 14-2641]